MQRTLLYVLGLLVSRQYQTLAKFSATDVQTPEMLKASIEEWPEKEQPNHFIMPPIDDIYQLIMKGGFNPIPGKLPEMWMPEVYLWTIEERQSALSLRLTIIDAPGEFYRVEVDDILVM